ncbi:MAG: GAF domain-containing protein [Candidatus Eisenbacteria bacterium]|nr:GAF domain-containing protein [Candidatus Eisenbacteria bacterium]
MTEGKSQDIERAQATSDDKCWETRPCGRADCPAHDAIEKAHRKLESEHAAVSSKYQQFSMLFKICNVMHGTIELERILKIILTSVTSGNALGFNRAMIFLVDEENGVLEGRMGTGPTSIEEASRIWSDLEASGATFEAVVKMSTENARCPEEPLTGVARSLVFPLSPGVDVTVQSVLEKRPFHVKDASSFEGPLSQKLRKDFGRSEFVVVPIMAKERALGAVIADNEFNRKPITEDEVDLLSSLAHQAGLALENARVYESLKLHFSEVSTLQEVGKGILSTTNLADVLELIARISAQVIGATGSVLWLHDEDAGQVIPRASFGKGTTIVERKLQNLGEELARWALAEKAPILVPDTASDVRFTDEEKAVARSLMAVPLKALDATIGVITVYDKMARSDFDTNVFEKEDEQFLAILADQAAIAVQNARLFEAFKEAERRLRDAQTLLLRTEKLAALGEMSAKMAHEIRNPLTSIGGFARRVSKALKANDPNKDYLEVIIKETERLERILNEQLQFAQLSRPRLKMEDLNSVVEQSLVLVSEESLRKKAKILKRLSLELPKLLLDSDKMKQVLINILQNALKFLPVGGKIKVETKRAGDFVHVIVGNEGERIPGELMDRLFVPFFTSGKDGTGLGLAVAYQIVKEHGGEIKVKSDDEWSTVFCVCLPISANQDRRRNMGDRRARMVDRRKPFADNF